MVLHFYSCLHYFNLLPINCVPMYSTHTKCNSQFLGGEPDTVLRSLCVLSLLIPPTIIQRKHYYCSHFPDEVSKA